MTFPKIKFGKLLKNLAKGALAGAGGTVGVQLEAGQPFDPQLTGAVALVMGVVNAVIELVRFLKKQKAAEES